jgi:hypothetical protein
MGAIHAATWKGRPVAAKMLHDYSKNALRALELELFVHARLCHPNIVTLFGELASHSTCCVSAQTWQGSVIRQQACPRLPAHRQHCARHSNSLSAARCSQAQTSRLLAAAW